MTYLHWKITSTWLQLKNEVEKRSLGTSLQTKEFKVQSSNALIFAKQSRCALNCTKNTLKELVEETVRTSCTSNQTSWPTVRWSRWVQLQSWSPNWMEILPFNQTNNFVFVSALGAARRLEDESKMGFLAIFNLDWTVKIYVERFFGKNGHERSQQTDVRHRLSVFYAIKSANTCWKVRVCTGKPVAKMNSSLTHIFGSGSRFSLAGNFQFPGNRREVLIDTPLTCHIWTRTVVPQFVCTACSHFTVTIITRHAWLKTWVDCVPLKIVHHLARHVSCFHTGYTQHLHSVLTFFYCIIMVDHGLNPLRRSTNSSRVWQLSWTTSSYRNQRSKSKMLTPKIHLLTC